MIFVHDASSMPAWLYIQKRFARVRRMWSSQAWVMFNAIASGSRRAWTLEIHGQLRYYMRVRTNFDKFAQNTLFKMVSRIMCVVS